MKIVLTGRTETGPGFICPKGIYRLPEEKCARASSFIQRGTGLALIPDVRENVFTCVRILPVERISRFEWAEPDNPSGTEQASIIRHPFLVTADDEGDYLLLEQSELFEELCQNGLSHVPAQVCSRERLKLSADRLNLTGLTSRDLVGLTVQHADQFIVDNEEKTAPSGYLTARLEFCDQRTVFLHMRHSSRIGCPAALGLLFRAINRTGGYIPALSSGVRPNTPLKVASVTGRLTLPSFDLRDLVSAAASERLYPPNLIRVASDCRVLNIDFPVSVLASESTTEEKEAFLHDLILYREQSRRTAVFDGQVYILNR